MTASAIRALFAVANRPEVVSLAGGMPNITDLPLDVVGATLEQLVLTDGRRAMQYGSGQGEPMIRDAISEVMKLEGIRRAPRRRHRDRRLAAGPRPHHPDLLRPG